MIEIHVDLRITVKDEDVEAATRLARQHAHDVVQRFHRSPTPHELEITNQDRPEQTPRRPRGAL